jgi:hypothetical protein
MWGQGEEMTQALYVHMNNKTVKNTYIYKKKHNPVKKTLYTHMNKIKMF